MKTVIAILWTVVFLIIAIPAMIKMAIVYKKDPWKAEKTAKRWITFYMNSIIFISGAKFTVTGLENVPEDTAVVYIGNHRSYFDIIKTYPLSKDRTSYVTKAEIAKLPTFGFWGRNMQCLFFDRKDIKASLKMILDGVDRLKQGNSIFIFPEGGRNKNKEMLPLNDFHDGTFKLASRSGCPVVPVAIKNSDAIWEAHSPWLRKAECSITYGKPIYMDDLSPEDKKHPGEYFKKVIEEMLSC